jgi:hypothetical protein
MTIKYTEEQLRSEITRALDAMQSRGEVLHPLWVTQAICKGHRNGLAAVAADDPPERHLDVAFWEFGGYTITRKISTACINDRDADGTADDAERQPMFPGFDHECLQAYYVVRRDGVDAGVPIMECTDDELRAKAALYLANSAKLEKHASELIRFIDYRAALNQAKQAAM